MSFLLTSLSALSVLDAACFFTFVDDRDVLIAASRPACLCSSVTSEVFTLDLALSALIDFTRVLDSLAAVGVAVASDLTTSVGVADGLLPVTARLLADADAGTVATLLDVSEERLRPVLVWSGNDLSGLSDGVTGRRDVEGLLAETVPRSDRGRDIDVVSLCSRRGRYKSRRRNNTGGDAEPTTDNSLQQGSDNWVHTQKPGFFG